METLSKSAFSRRLHVSPARVTQMIAKGMPVTPDGKVDVAEALNWIESHIDLSHKDAVARRQAEQPPLPPPAGDAVAIARRNAAGRRDHAGPRPGAADREGQAGHR